jgi:hypothetical protein
MTSSLEMCETCKWLQGIACSHPDLDTMPYEKGCSFWEAIESPGKLTAEEIRRGILSKSMSRDQRAQFEVACKENEARRKAGRRITQISSHQGGVWALCDDGTLWLGSYQRKEWEEMPPIPLACDVPEVPEPKAPERRILLVTHKKNDERVRKSGDKVTLIKPADLDRLTRGCEFDHVIFDEGIRYHDVAEHLYMILLRMRNGTLESSKDFFAKSGFLSFSDVIKRSGEIS